MTETVTVGDTVLVTSLDGVTVAVTLGVFDRVTVLVGVAVFDLVTVGVGVGVGLVWVVKGVGVLVFVCV